MEGELDSPPPLSPQGSFNELILKMAKKFWILVFLSLLLPFFTQAQPGGILTLPTVPVATVLKRLADILFYILVGLALLFVVWGGIAFVAASGDPNKIENAKRIVIFALIGIGVGAVAFGIVNLIYSYLTGAGGGGAPGPGVPPLPPPPTW